MSNSPSSLPQVVLSLLSPAGQAAAQAEIARRETERRRWRRIARPDQLAPGSPGAAIARDDWTFWLPLAGRGWGKTRVGAEWAIEQARDNPGTHGAIVAATFPDAQKVMLSYGLESQQGASGILAVSPPDFRPAYEISRNRLVWPNGTVADLYTAEEPGRLRGPQHHWAWVDEIAAWEKEHAAWDQLLFGLRLGKRPRACITTTPRPIQIVKQLIADPQTVVTRGRTRDNAANLAPSFFDSIVRKYEGTRLGRQELDGEILEDVEGALWSGAMIERLRVKEAPELKRIVIAIDPAVSSDEGADETGIIVFGVGACNCKGAVEDHGFVLADLSGAHSPSKWAQIAVDALREWGADRVIAEVNNGGDLVEMNLRTVDRNVPYTAVHASRGKRSRAEPIAALYEQGKVHHVGGFPIPAPPRRGLEDQMTGWTPLGNHRSPDRMDALVWAAHDCMIQDEMTSSDWLMRAQLF